MKKTVLTNRRRFVQFSAAALGSTVLFPAQNLLAGGHLPKLEESDPQAVALGYKHEASDVDASKYSKFTAEQNCANCIVYQGKEDNNWGPCSIFPGKEVSASGWCSAYAPKES